MGIKNQRQYTLEFKLQAVQLAEELKSGPKAALQLGIPKACIYTWRTLARAGALGGGDGSVSAMKAPAPPSLVEENRRLQRELAEQKKINHILKAAAAFFSQDHLK